MMTALAAFAAFPAAARTPTETTAIVMKFNGVFRGQLTRDQLTTLVSDDFIEHHPIAVDAQPERTKKEFIDHFTHMPPRPAGAPAGAGPPPPVVTMATEDYVLLMSKRDTPYAADPTRRYEAFIFDLFRVNATGQVAEHWDSFRAEDRMGPAADQDAITRKAASVRMPDEAGPISLHRDGPK